VEQLKLHGAGIPPDLNADRVTVTLAALVAASICLFSYREQSLAMLQTDARLAAPRLL
jgi:hypothetical protein